MPVMRSAGSGATIMRPISLFCSLILGLFVDAACNYCAMIVSKVNGSFPGRLLLFLVADNQVDGGGGLGWWAYVRRRAPNSSRGPSFVLAFGTKMSAMRIVVCFDA
jgi:hypothetical protein